jgi:3-oxoacyl-[acyl-carrier-protein] synthase II
MRRVVITGLGLVTPLACGYETTWKRLVAGHNAARRIDNFDVSDLTCQVAPSAATGPMAASTRRLMELKEQRKVDEFIVMPWSRP